MSGNRNVPSWLLKDMGYQEDSASSQNVTSSSEENGRNEMARRKERAKAFLQRKLKGSLSSSSSSSSSPGRSRKVFSRSKTKQDEENGTYRKGDRVRVLSGKRKGKLGRILGKSKKSESKWRVRVGTYMVCRAV